MNRDPLTGQPLPSNAIQRILFLCPNAHVYQIPPLRSTKGHAASDWTNPTRPTAQEIFQPRLRLLETAIPAPDGASERLSVALLLEDKATGELFAAVPYTDAAAVEPAIDSSRFFAVRVVGDGGRKAVLGLGFEERSDAVDFSIALQDARKTLGWEKAAPVGGAAPAAAPAGTPPNARGGRRAPPHPAHQYQQQQQQQQQEQQVPEVKRDFRLKEGEMITVNFGQKGRRSGGSNSPGAKQSEPQDLSMFALRPPPPSAGGKAGGEMPMLAPPPSARNYREDKGRRISGNFGVQNIDAKELGFDDGEFGEFQ
jgi:adaptin ear-binding coat-associated protein 1/2